LQKSNFLLISSIYKKDNLFVVKFRLVVKCKTKKAAMPASMPEGKTVSLVLNLTDKNKKHRSIAAAKKKVDFKKWVKGLLCSKSLCLKINCCIFRLSVHLIYPDCYIVA
jgi:hypothetical protein